MLEWMRDLINLAGGNIVCVQRRSASFHELNSGPRCNIYQIRHPMSGGRMQEHVLRVLLDAVSFWDENIASCMSLNP